jgi:periplasmic protein TonB
MAVAEYQLKSELARVCLPAPERQASRRPAWASSISLLFLLIGITGMQSKLPLLRTVPPLEQPAPIIIEPLPPVTPPPTAEQKPSEQQNDDDKPETPHVQAVVIDAPNINFSVPTPGSLLVPMNAAEAPQQGSMRRAAAPVVKQEPQAITTTGKGGDRPQPDYPERALLLQLQGTVTLLLKVDDAGRVISSDVTESSGSPILDEAARRDTKRRWTVPPAEFHGGRLFTVSIRYVLREKAN